MATLFRNKALLALSLSHFTTDLYSGSIPILLLFLSKPLDLSVLQIGLATGTYTLFSSISQPLFGYFGDLKGGRWFVAGGVLMISIFQGLMGLAPSFSVLLLCAALAGCGSAAFHPQGASGASRASGDRKTTGMAIFMLGGNGGYATGPLVTGLILNTFGRLGTPFMAMFGIILAPILFKLVGKPPEGAARTSGRSLLKFNTAFSRFAIVALMLVMLMRAWAQSAVSAYSPTYFTTLAGFSAAQVSVLSGVNLWALALGSLTGGVLADRVGGRKLMLVSFLTAAPLLFLYFNTLDTRVFYVAAAAGFMVGASWPPLLVMSQDLFPRSAGLASGLSLGFVFAMGGIGSIISGWLAEPARLGLHGSMMIVSGLPLVALLFALALPSRERIAQAVRHALDRSAAVLGADAATGAASMSSPAK